MSNYIERYWRDATPQDAIREPPMVARFRDDGDNEWFYNLLVGWDRTEKWPWRSEANLYDQCQVYDAPDPGEGWRLLHPDEDVEQGDEFFDKCNRVWLIAIESEQYKDRIYRRRTTPQYVPYTWDDRDELRGRWYRQKNDGHEQVAYYLANRDSDFRINSYLSEEFLELCEWLDGTPCGKKVL